MIMTIGCGLGMAVLCMLGIKPGVKVALIQQGIITTFIMIAGYILGMSFIINSRFKEKAKLKNTELEI